MKTITSDIKNEITVKKSVFITYLYHINDKEEAINKLKSLRSEYYHASHICYAYIINEDIKCSDDKEPLKTAGIPILNVLQKNDLNNVLAVVIRFFGGILLGKGGLVRAYSGSVVEALKLTNLIPIVACEKIVMFIPYDKQKVVDHILKDYSVKKSYGLNIIYEADIPITNLNDIKKQLSNEKIVIKKDT